MCAMFQPSEIVIQDRITLFISGIEYIYICVNLNSCEEIKSREWRQKRIKNRTNCGKKTYEESTTKRIMSNMVFYFIFTETSLRKWLVEKQPVHASLLANFFFFALCTRIYMHKNNFLFCFQLNSFCFVLILMTFYSNCQTKFSAHFFVCQLLFFFFSTSFFSIWLLFSSVCVWKFCWFLRSC